MSHFVASRLINTADLRIGMYVCQLEVPWVQTEFPIQGVLIKSQEDIFRISHYGDTLFIDETKSSPLCLEVRNATKKSPKHAGQPAKTTLQKTAAELARKVPRQRPYRDVSWDDCIRVYKKQKPIARESLKAREIITRLSCVFNEFKKDITHFDEHKLSQLESVSREIVSSLLSNPDALLWLSKVNASHRHVLDHCIRASILATIIGRSMGLQRKALQRLNMAVLLSCVGKSQLQRFVWSEYNPLAIGMNYALWSQLAVEKLSHCKGVDPQVLNIISNMTERFDGSGFPSHKSGDEIPLLAQIAGLAESFDLMLNPMHCIKKTCFSHAIGMLNSLADSQFDGELIDELIQSTGPYPVGTHVMLSNGYYGVVVEQSASHRIRALVVLTHARNKNRLKHFCIVQLGEGKYANVIIRREVERFQDELISEDFSQINQMIGQYKNNFMVRLLYFFRRNFQLSYQ